MRDLRLRCVLMLFALLQAGWSGAGEQGWKAGVARTEITPPQGLWMAGYAARTRPAEGVLQPLWVKALALQAPGSDPAVVVTSDLLGFPRTLSGRVAAALRERFGLERSRVMLTSSHTHSGPVLSGALLDIYPMDEQQWGLVDGYSRQLETRIVETVGAALAGMQPAWLYSGAGRASFAVNRRNNKEGDVPSLQARGVRLKGPVDHSVPVLAVRDAAGKLVAILFGYACHATTLDQYEWSGDYPGVAQLALESGHPGAVALFHAGCGADQNPIPRRTVELCEKYGKMLAVSVDAVLGRRMKRVDPGLATAFSVAELGFEAPLSRARLDQIASESAGYRQRWAKRLIALHQQGTVFETGYPYPVQVWRLGRKQMWVALGGEVVVDYPLRLKKKYGSGTWVTGYANDVMAYIPSSRIQREGGYETSSMDVYGLPGTGWARDVEERIIAAVDALLAQTGRR